MPRLLQLRRYFAFMFCAGLCLAFLSQAWADTKPVNRSKVSAPNPFDLNLQKLHFAPNANGGYDVTSVPFAYDSNLGTGLNAGDDTNHEVVFTNGFTFTFFGTTWNSVWVRSNANVTFGGIGNPDFYDPFDFFLELPMIAALFADLNPAATGEVFYKQLSDRFVVTWDRITEFDANNSNTVQLTLFANGSFDFAYNGVGIQIPINGSPLIVGFNAGRLRPSSQRVDFSLVPIIGSSADKLYEVFGEIALYQGPATGIIISGAAVSTDNFPLASEAGTARTDRTPKEMPRHDIALLPDPGNLRPATHPAGSNEIYDIAKKPTETNAPIIVSGFRGIQDDGFFPPDPHMAAGPNHVIGTVNSQFAIFDKSGTMLKLINVDDWFGNVLPGEFPGDPQILYDHHSTRWFMIWHNAGFPPVSMLLSVSDDSNPLGTWCNWELPGNQLGSTPTELFNDYPKIGVDRDAFYVTDNMGGFVRLRIISKAQLLNTGCGPVTWTDFWDLRDPDNLAFPVFTVVPAVTFGTLDAEYLINDSPYETGTFMTLWKLSNPIGEPTLSAVNVPVTASFGGPSNADQLGGSPNLIEVGGRRVRNAVYMNGSLWTAHSIAGGTDRAFAFARYVRIDVNTETALEDVALGADDFWYYYPAIHPDANGNMFMVFTRSGLTEYPSARYTGRLQNDLPGLQASALLKAGEANYMRVGDGRNRWGDYLGIALDPADGSKVWMFGQYADSPRNTWGTWFGQASFTPLSGRHLLFEPQSLQFDSVDVGETGETLEVIVSNIGADDVTITALNNSLPSFELAGVPSLPLVLSSFGEIRLSVTFAPTSGGALEDTIRIQSNDPANSSIRIALSGRAFGTAALSGTVKDNLSNAPISALLEFVRQGETVPRATVRTNPDGSYETVVREGTYDVSVFPEFPYPAALLENIVHTLAGTTRDILLQTAQVALVKDDSTGTADGILGGIVGGLGYTYSIWDRFTEGETAPADKIRLLSEPAILFWTTGSTSTDVLTAEDRAVIRGHLDNGARLILTGDNIAETSTANDSLMTVYLGVEFASNFSQVVIKGFTGDPIGNGLLIGAPGSSKDQLRLSASRRSQVNKVFQYGSTAADTVRIAAVRAQDPAVNWKAAFFGFALENVTALRRATVIERTVQWLTVLIDAVEDRAPADRPYTFRLLQNHPNPFNPATTITYELDQASLISLKVYNALGQEVATLVNELKAAGRHEVLFNAVHLSGGIYLMELRAGEFVAMRKLVVVK